MPFEAQERFMQSQSTLQPYFACPEAILGMACGALGIHVILGIHGALRTWDLPSQQTTRDYPTGPTSWRLGIGRGKLSALNTDRAYKRGKRGGAEAKAILMSKLVPLRRCCPSTIDTDG